MANVDRPNGLSPVRHLSGGTIRPNSYTIAAAYASKIHSGALVSTTGTGRDISLADEDGPVVGVFAGCQYQDSEGEFQFKPYWPAPGAVATGTTVEAYVYDDPNTIFEVQADGAFVVADVGQLADQDGIGGSDSTGRSTAELDSSDINGSAGLFKIIGIAKRPDNDYGTNAKVEVVIALHELSSLAAV